MDMTGVIVILLVACLILISICLGLALGVLLMLRRRNTQAIGPTERVSKTAESEQAASQASKGLEEQMANIHEEIRGESMRQLILVPSAIAIGVAMAVLTPRTDPIGGAILAILGLFGLMMGLSAPRKWLTRKVGLRKRR